MDYWCPAPLPGGMEPRRKLRSSEDWQVPPADQLEGYLSDSSVEAEGDDDPEVADVSTTKPTRRTCAAATKVSSSRAEAIKTTKAEAEKKRKMGKGVASSSSKPTDEVVASSGSEDEVDAPRSPSPETK